MEKEKFMKEALKEAQKAFDKEEVPVGAVIVKDGKIIARAHNLKESKKQPTSHAEILAIEKACKKLDAWRLEDCEMYVTLEPCMMCCGALIQSRIKKVIYGAKSYQNGAIESLFKAFDVKGLNHYVETVYFDKLEDCSKIITNYFKTKR